MIYSSQWEFGIIRPVPEGRPSATHLSVKVRRPTCSGNKSVQLVDHYGQFYITFYFYSCHDIHFGPHFIYFSSPFNYTHVILISEAGKRVSGESMRCIRTMWSSWYSRRQECNIQKKKISVGQFTYYWVRASQPASQRTDELLLLRLAGLLLNG